MPDLIQTKLLFEYKKGQLLGLGFGNIVNSDADIICISAFDEPSFKPNSAIGELNEYLAKHFKYSIEEKVNNELKPGTSILLTIPNTDSKKKVMVVCMGQRSLVRNKDKDYLATHVLNSLKVALEKAKILLLNEPDKFSIDVTALGTKYGGIRRKESFDLLINWASDLFQYNKKVSLLRFIAYDLDTFVDFYESIYRLQKVRPEDELIFSATYNLENFDQFKGDINSALRSLDDNPRGVIITCRSIIEMIVKTITNQPLMKLADGIHSLKDSVPPNIFSYLTTCRVIGNFSNHDPNFQPTRRDAEGILLLTLRIVEWHLATINPAS